MTAPVLRQWRQFESSDLDDTRERISRIMQPHRLTPDGAAAGFRAHMDFMRVGAVGLGTIRFGAMTVEVPRLGDYHLLVFCLKGRAVATLPGGDGAIDDARGVALNPGDRLLARFSEDSEQLVIRMDRAALQRHSGLARPVLDPVVDLGRPEIGPFVRHLRALLTDLDLMALARRDPRVHAEYERLLLTLLACGHPVARPERERGIAPATVRRAEAFMRAHAHEPITLADIAAAAGVPIRTLQEGFRRFRSTSATRLLRDTRLDAARARLLSGDRAGGVSAVAMDCGFGHLSRFASAYRERFGEWPSETRARINGPRVRETRAVR